MSAMLIETLSVVFAAALVWLSVTAQHVANVSARGATYAVGDRSTAPEMTGFYGRASRTLNNNIESALMYVPPTILIIQMGHSTTVTQWAAIIHIVARTVFTISYWMRIPNIRSLGWLVGMLCAAAMIFTATLVLW